MGICLNGVPEKPLLFGERRSRITRSRRTNRIRLPSTANDDAVEPGETKEEALIRECREELGVTITVGDVFMDVVHEYPDITVHLTLFHAKITEGTIQLLEHNAVAWITPAEIPDYDFCPADKDINERIQAEKFAQMAGESK